MTIHKYRGQTIYPCERARGEHRGRWVVGGYHAPTGMPYADELCPHFQSLADARAWIGDGVRVGATARAWIDREKKKWFATPGAEAAND